MSRFWRRITERIIWFLLLMVAIILVMLALFGKVAACLTMIA